MSANYDVIIIGGGHAGAEAAWAAAGLGAATAPVTFDPKKIGQMSCNPAIGGLAKGQMVREIDALGGLMGLATDATGIQFRMLNRSKGPAVWGPRAQADKYRYAAEVQRLLAGRSGLDILAGEVEDIHTDPSGAIAAVTLKDGRRLNCRAVVVTTGTFLRALMHTGESQTPGGRVGEAAAQGLSGCLARLGLELGRLKTGTPPRLSRASIDLSVFEQQPGDEEPMPFSFMNEYPFSRDPKGSASGDHQRQDALPFGSRLNGETGAWRPPLPQVHCWLSATNGEIHELIRRNLHRAPMYSGQISSIGPRYCPSIEDKVVRFADKPAHQIFLEPEGLDTDEIYCNGISTSLPADVQEQIIRLIPGLESAKILRFGYAVEYDMVWPSQIRSTMQTKKVPGLFLAGQINGTSGYEEAAAQGLVAGVNAARLALRGEREQAEFVLRRDQAYIGVLVDDLTTKPPIEPYRMFTSRAEHRLHLRNDNADERLTEIGRAIGLVDDARWAGFLDRRQRTEIAMSLLSELRVGEGSALEFLRQSQVTWPMLVERVPAAAAIDTDVARQIDIRVKYEGYIARQDRLIAQSAHWEQKLIPKTFDYSAIVGLRNEARQKLIKFTPRSLGQALRISGVTPADVTVLAIHLEHRRRQESA